MKVLRIVVLLTSIFFCGVLFGQKISWRTIRSNNKSLFQFYLISELGDTLKTVPFLYDWFAIFDKVSGDTCAVGGCYQDDNHPYVDYYDAHLDLVFRAMDVAKATPIKNGLSITSSYYGSPLGAVDSLGREIFKTEYTECIIINDYVIAVNQNIHPDSFVFSFRKKNYPDSREQISFNMKIPESLIVVDFIPWTLAGMIYGYYTDTYPFVDSYDPDVNEFIEGVKQVYEMDFLLSEKHFYSLLHSKNRTLRRAAKYNIRQIRSRKNQKENHLERK